LDFCKFVIGLIYDEIYAQKKARLGPIINYKYNTKVGRAEMVEAKIYKKHLKTGEY